MGNYYNNALGFSDYDFFRSCDRIRVLRNRQICSADIVAIKID